LLSTKITCYKKIGNTLKLSYSTGQTRIALEVTKAEGPVGLHGHCPRWKPLL